MTPNQKPDPYADLGEVYAEELRLPARPTPKTATDGGDEGIEVPEVPLHSGFHIDGDKRYQEL